MGRFRIKVLTSVFLIASFCFVLAPTAHATLISGSIGFGGTYKAYGGDPLEQVFDLRQATFIDILSASVLTGDGDFAGYNIVEAYNDMTLVSFPISPLWVVRNGSGDTMSFTVTSFAVTLQTATSLTLTGTGIMTSSNSELEATSGGNWTFTANANGNSFTWSDSAAVPEPCTLLLLGGGFMGCAIFAKRRKIKAS